MQLWPWPGDTREDRAKRVALAYRRLALALVAGETLDPAGALAELDDRWRGLGAAWVQPTAQPLDLDAWLPAGELAELLCIDPQWLRDWARRGHIRAAEFQSTRRYCVGDVVAYQRDRLMRRAAVLS